MHQQPSRSPQRADADAILAAPVVAELLEAEHGPPLFTVATSREQLHALAADSPRPAWGLRGHWLALLADRGERLTPVVRFDLRARSWHRTALRNALRSESFLVGAAENAGTDPSAGSLEVYVEAEDATFIETALAQAS